MKVMKVIANLCLLMFLATSTMTAAGQNHDPSFRVPKDIPKAAYRVNIQIDLNEKLISGDASVNLENTGKVPLEVIAFDWTMNDYSMISVSQNKMTPWR